MRISSKEKGLEWDKIENHLSKMKNKEDLIMNIGEIEYINGNLVTTYIFYLTYIHY